MFTSLTIAAAWFAFGYSFTNLMMTIAKNNKEGKYDEPRNQTHSGTDSD